MTEESPDPAEVWNTIKNNLSYFENQKIMASHQGKTVAQFLSEVLFE